MDNLHDGYFSDDIYPKESHDISTQIFKSQTIIGRCEEFMFEWLLDHFKKVYNDSLGEYPIEDLQWDYYDSSLEIMDAHPNIFLDRVSREKIWGWGFTRVWVNHSDKCETYYHRDGVYEDDGVKPRRMGGRGPSQKEGRLRDEIKNLKVELEKVKKDVG